MISEIRITQIIQIVRVKVFYVKKAPIVSKNFCSKLTLTTFDKGFTIYDKENSG